MKTLFLPILAVAALAGAAQAAPPARVAAKVTVEGAWCRAAPKGAPAGGCYLTLTAVSADQLVSVETPAAARAEIHTMSMDGGVMRMRKLADGLALPAGQAVALKPGAEHLMVIGPKIDLVAGASVPLTLRFKFAPPVAINVPVKAVGGK